MRLFIIFTFYIFFAHLGAVKAIVFFHFPRSFQHPVFQSLTSDQTNDDDNQIPPFPSFFSVFRHRYVNPFQNFWRDVIKTSTPEPATKDESKVNDTLDFKTDNITGHMNMQEASTLTPKHHILKKDIENSTKQHGSERFYPAWRRFISFRDLKPLVYNERITKNSNNILKKTQSGSHLENYLRANSSNNTPGNATKNSLQAYEVYEENCTRHYISRYLFIWTINWASLAIHLTVILLLSSFVTVAIIICRSCCTYDQSASEMYKIKPLNV